MKTLSFFPSQPEIKYKMDNYIEQKPFNSNDVALYYQFNTNDKSINSFALIPDGSIDLLFCCDPNNLSSFLWTSPIYRSEQLDFQEGCEYFGVRLYPEQRILNLNYSMRELLGKKIPLVDLLSIDLNIEQLLIGKSFNEKIQLFEKFIESITPNFKYNDVIEYSIKQIYLSKGNINVNQLTVDTGYSDRYLRKKFEEYIGFSPKQFSKIVRFQNSLAMIFKENSYNSLDIVYENGYHDHPHFIREFKKFAQLTPTQFLENLF